MLVEVPMRVHIPPSIAKKESGMRTRLGLTPLP